MPRVVRAKLSAMTSPVCPVLQGASGEEKKRAMSSAEKMLQEGGYAKTTKVSNDYSNNK